MSLNAQTIASDLAAALSAIAGANTLDELKEVKSKFVGDKSAIAKANQGLGGLEPAQRAELGKVIGAARAEINQSFSERVRILTEIRDAKVLLEERVDVTLPTHRVNRGGLHPLTILTHEISDLFVGLGYTVAEGPELESGWLNFDALNIPADHPARTMQDTFFIS